MSFYSRDTVSGFNKRGEWDFKREGNIHTKVWKLVLGLLQGWSSQTSRICVGGQSSHSQSPGIDWHCICRHAGKKIFHWFFCWKNSHSFPGKPLSLFTLTKGLSMWVGGGVLQIYRSYMCTAGTCITTWMHTYYMHSHRAGQCMEILGGNCSYDCLFPSLAEFP